MFYMLLFDVYFQSGNTKWIEAFDTQAATYRNVHLFAALQYQRIIICISHVFGLKYKVETCIYGVKTTNWYHLMRIDGAERQMYRIYTENTIKWTLLVEQTHLFQPVLLLQLLIYLYICIFYDYLRRNSKSNYLR